jgi:hypothetical protein
MTKASLEKLRAHVDATVHHATDLLESLVSLDEALQLLMPSLADLTDGERDAFVARLCGYDGDLPARLRALVESLADVIAGLTTSDGGHAWLALHLARLEAGDEEAA